MNLFTAALPAAWTAIFALCLPAIGAEMQMIVRRVPFSSSGALRVSSTRQRRLA